jgi:hypothetical protein
MGCCGGVDPARKKKNGPGKGRWAAAERKIQASGKKRGREGDGRRRDWAETKGEGFSFFFVFFQNLFKPRILFKV